jgi:hypothetical protein
MCERAPPMHRHRIDPRAFSSTARKHRWNVVFLSIAIRALDTRHAVSTRSLAACERVIKRRVERRFTI